MQATDAWQYRFVSCLEQFGSGAKDCQGSSLDTLDDIANDALDDGPRETQDLLANKPDGGADFSPSAVMVDIPA